MSKYLQFENLIIWWWWCFEQSVCDIFGQIEINNNNNN